MQSDHVDIPQDHIFYTWTKLFEDGGEKVGQSFDIAIGHNMRDRVREAGFVDVVEKKIKVPFHGWPKDASLKQIGYLAQAAMDQSLEGLALYMAVEVLGWSFEEATVLIATMRREMRKVSLCPWVWV